MLIKLIQDALKKTQIDGWLLYDFQGNNPLARQMLGIPQQQHLTRRFFYWIPKEGEPIKIVHAIESTALDKLPGEKLLYLQWEVLHENLQEILPSGKKVAMEYSPNCALPYISKVDAGTVELVRTFGVEVVSSAPLLQQFTSIWDSNKWESHCRAAKLVDEVVGGAWEKIRKALKEEKPLTEFELQQWILREFDKAGFYTEWDPICAFNEHSADPHFSPEKEESYVLKRGDFVLIDLGCKEKKPGSVYADFTRVAVAAENPTPKQEEIFRIVKEARDAAIALIRMRMESGKEVMGCEADRACREVIENAGYGKQFIHRTGHNIDEDVHGPGAHLDSLETLDDRLLIPSTCFSVEPGIYLPGEFGVRLECDVYISPERKVIVSGELQQKIPTIY